jgi:hypothetical protein
MEKALNYSREFEYQKFGSIETALSSENINSHSKDKTLSSRG